MNVQVDVIKHEKQFTFRGGDLSSVSCNEEEMGLALKNAVQFLWGSVKKKNKEDSRSGFGDKRKSKDEARFPVIIFLFLLLTVSFIILYIFFLLLLSLLFFGLLRLADVHFLTDLMTPEARLDLGRRLV